MGIPEQRYSDKHGYRLKRGQDKENEALGMDVVSRGWPAVKGIGAVARRCEWDMIRFGSGKRSNETVTALYSKQMHKWTTGRVCWDFLVSSTTWPN